MPEHTWVGELETISKGGDKTEQTDAIINNKSEKATAPQFSTLF